MPLLPTLFVAGLVLSMALPAAASSELRWLNDSPVRFFTDKDWELSNAARDRALEDSADGETVEWSNEESGSYGSVTPLSRVERDGLTCREAQIVNHARGRDGTSRFEFCQDADGRWGVGGPPPPPR